MKNMMKKIMTVTLLFAIIGTSLSIGNVQAASNESKAKKYLDAASKDCKKIMDTIDASWYYQVYSADEYSGSAILDFYASDVGIPKSKVKSIIKKKYGENDWAGQAACIQVLSYNLGIVHTYYSDKGTFKKIKKNLENAKKECKKIKGSKKKKYVKYYNAVNKYYRYVYSPTGSYLGLEAKKDSLNTGIDDAKDALSW